MQRPIGPYGRSKVGAERLLMQACREFGLHATIFRPRLIAGAGRLGILTKLFRLIRAGLPIPLIGAGKNRYQMIAVEDCVAAALAAVERIARLVHFISAPVNRLLSKSFSENWSGEPAQDRSFFPYRRLF
ncbi:hypothetical protein AJ87_21295 [Rhizobium yanglingense]|nr:hypothetical protein AJ87_21295 [Rhizobium yanglingense]